MLITIELPVSKHIKQFLVQKFGESFTPCRDNWLGVLITSLMEKKTTSWDTRLVNKEHFEYFYKISFSISYFNKYGIHLLPVHQQLLRKAIESNFREYIYEMAILNKEYYGIDYKTTIENTLDFYGIDEQDKSYYQTIIRDFNRKKEKILQKMNSK